MARRINAQPITALALITAQGRVLAAVQNAPTRNLAALLAQFARLPRDERVSYVVSEKVRYLYQLLQDVFVVVVTTTASNVLADQDVLQAVVRVLTARFGGVCEEVVEDNVFEATDVLTEFCNYDGSCEVLTEGEVDACLAMESHEEELFLEELKRKKEEAKEVARQKAAELEAERRRREEEERLRARELEHEEKMAELDRLREEQIVRMREQEQEEEERRRAQRKKQPATARPRGLVLGQRRVIADDPFA